MKKILGSIVLIAIVISGLVLLKKRRQEVADLPVALPAGYTVRIIAPTERKVVESRSFLATLKADKRVEISTRVSGRITGLLVRESQQVEQGELLVTVDDQDLQTSLAGSKAQLLAAKSRLKYNRKLYERNRKLYDAGGLPKEKLEESEVGWQASRAAKLELEQKVKGMLNQLTYTRIETPFKAVVGSIIQNQGDLAVPGRPILSLNSLEQKLTFSFVPGKSSVQTGQKVVVAETGETGEIVTIYNDSTQGLAIAELRLGKKLELPMGSYVSVNVIIAEQSGCSVPLEAILHRKNGTGIMVYTEENRFEEQAVDVVAADSEFALITPCVQHHVAVASEARLSLLPTWGKVEVIMGESHE